MKRLFVLLIAAAVVLPFAYATARGGGAAVKRTAICHRTGSAKPAYKRMLVNAAQVKAHAKHAADIVPVRGACPTSVLTANAGGVARTASMTGEVENPAGDPVATGTAVIRARANQGQICFTLDVDNLGAAAAAAHIHQAPAGSVGAIVVPLTTPDSSGASSGCTSVARPLVNAILGSPAQYYVNVHTAAFPGGAVRGQLAGTSPDDLGWSRSVAMNGAAEAPANGDSDGAGVAVVRIRPDNQVCYRIGVQNLLLPAVGAHIHRGAAGGAGPIVVPFTAPDASGISSGCAAADPTLLADIKANPAGFYTNVHTREFPGGAIRAQLG
jgi:hypothetical protein